jgi:PAS domain S-box-containing protein
MEGQETGAGTKPGTRWRQANMERLIVACAVISCTALLSISIIGNESFLKFTRSNHWALHSEMVNADLNELLAGIAAAESAERGYDLTGDERYVSAYHAALARARDRISEVARLTSDNPSQQRRLASLSKLFAEKRAFMEQAIQNRRASGRSSKSMLGDGDQLQQRITAKIRSMDAEERSLLVERSSAAEKSARRTIRLSVFGALISVSLLGIAGFTVHRNIQELKRVENELAHERDLLSTLMDNIPDYIYFKDQNGCFTRVNRALANALCLAAPEQALGKNELHFTSPDYAAKTLEEEKNIMQTGQPLVGKVERIDWPGKGAGWGLSTKIPIVSTDGRPAGLVGVTKDVTEMKEWEERLKDANAQLERKVEERTEQLRALNQSLDRRVTERTAQLVAANKELEAFTYSVSHDLRAPLRQIAGFASILMEECRPGLDAKTQHYLQRVDTGARRMASLVDALLTLGGIGRAEISTKPANLNVIVQDVIEDLKSEAGGRQIEWKVAALPVVQCDPVLIRQVFANLITNAVKFTKGRERAVIEVGETGGEGEVVIFVRDNGVGFDMKYAGQLFGVFHRLHSAEEFEGTGIGLATVRRIVHKHGGRVWAESKPDGGAAFYFTLGRGKENSSESILPEGNHELIGNRNPIG